MDGQTVCLGAARKGLCGERGRPLGAPVTSESAAAPVVTSPRGGHELLAILLRRPRPSSRVAAALPPGRRFGSERGPTSSVLVPIGVIGLMGDVPFSMVLVSAFHPAHPLWLHAVILVLALAALGWAVTARSARVAIAHVVTDATMVIRDGLDLHIEVPRSAVVSAQVLSGSPRAWMTHHGIATCDVLRASLLDAPNLVLEVDAPARGLVMMRHGRPLAPRRWVMLYADEPAALRTVLAHGEGH